MKRGFKFISRLIVGIVLIILSGVLIWNLFNTIVVPKLPVIKGAGCKWFNEWPGQNVCKKCYFKNF